MDSGEGCLGRRGPQSGAKTPTALWDGGAVTPVTRVTTPARHGLESGSRAPARPLGRFGRELRPQQERPWDPPKRSCSVGPSGPGRLVFRPWMAWTDRRFQTRRFSANFLRGSARSPDPTDRLKVRLSRRPRWRSDLPEKTLPHFHVPTCQRSRVGPRAFGQAVPVEIHGREDTFSLLVTNVT